MTGEDRWGRRRLAFSIQGHREGFYIILTHTSEPGVVAALDHFFNVTDTVMRHMTVKVIKSKKTFRPRRERPAGAPDHRAGGRPGAPNRGPRPTGVPTAAPAEAGSAPAAAAPAPIAAPAPAPTEGGKPA